MRNSGTADASAAVVAEEPGLLGIRTVELPPLEDDCVLIRTLISGISTGTDRWVVTGQFEWGGFPFPLVPGYQRIGIVESVGASVDSVVAGDVVFATSSRDFVGVSAGWGAHAAWAVSHEEEVFSAQGVPRASGALAVSIQVGVNAASRLSQPAEHRVLVVGDGVIGASAALAAHLRGARVLLAGHHDERLDAVAAVQPDIRVVNSHRDWSAPLSEWMPTAVIDTIQRESVTNDYIRYLPCTWNSAGSVNAKSGSAEIVFAGHSPGGVTAWADMALLQKHEVTIHMISGWTRQRIQHTLELLRSKRMTLDPLIRRIDSSTSDMADLLQDVADGRLASVAACIEWDSE
jgi:2-desacetyl-2-hydroxyethyl bacteriochlorophyllide A dehydrogenase